MRNRNRVLGPVGDTVEHKISDKAARLWESYQRPMQGAAHAMNAAIQNCEQVLGKIILEMEGFSPETHGIDLTRMVILPRITQPPKQV